MDSPLSPGKQDTGHAEKYLVWVCPGCEKCRHESEDGCAPGPPKDIDMPCSDESPSLNGAWVVHAEDYARLLKSYREVMAACMDFDGGKISREEWFSRVAF